MRIPPFRHAAIVAACLAALMGAAAPRDGYDDSQEPRYANVTMGEMASLEAIRDVADQDQRTAALHAVWLKKKGIQ